MPTSNPIEPERGSRSIKEWCAFRHYSIATFYNMKRAGSAPKIIQPLHSPPRITYAADAEWEEAQNNPSADKAAKAADVSAERLERTRKAGAKAVLSLRHPKTRGRPAAKRVVK